VLLEEVFPSKRAETSGGGEYADSYFVRRKPSLHPVDTE
jgi:hypothetical protein